MEILTVKNLKKHFKRVEVLHDISFDVKKGEVVAIIGPSGSGKSTLLRCINQLEKVNSGYIGIKGSSLVSTDAEGNTAYANKLNLQALSLKMGLVFQDFQLFPHMSVMENIIAAPINVQKKSKEEATAKARELLDLMGLADRANSYPYQLSGGQSQRVSIARAMALNPEILFFDEPTSALDPELTGEVLKIIRSLADLSMTMVIVTHEMAFAKDVADRIIFMDSGYIIEDCTPAELFASKNERTKEFLGMVTSD